MIPQTDLPRRERRKANRPNKIPTETRVAWMVSSTITDFVTAFLMLLLGALGIHWGYWHAWWVTFCGTAVGGAVLYPIVCRLDHLLER